MARTSEPTLAIKGESIGRLARYRVDIGLVLVGDIVRVAVASGSQGLQRSDNAIDIGILHGARGIRMRGVALRVDRRASVKIAVGTNLPATPIESK
jgi:hypothetical protein